MSERANTAGTAYFLEVVDPPDLELRHRLPPKQRVLVGRSPQMADLVVGDESMSRQHFAIAAGPDGFRLEDQDSTGGTFVNGERVAEQVVGLNDDIRAGRTRFKIVERSVAEAERQATAPPREEQASATAGLDRPTEADSPPPGFRTDDVPAIFEQEEPELDEEAAALAVKQPSCDEVVAALRSAGLLLDAVRFLPHALPRRKAVWWGCRCVRSVAAEGAEFGEPALAALDAAEAWVRDPSEEHRRAAHAAAEKATFETPAAWTCMAAFWSEGSMGPPEAPAVPPAPGLLPKAVRGAAQLAAVAHEPQHADERFGRFIDLATEIAEASEPWAEESAR